MLTDILSRMENAPSQPPPQYNARISFDVMNCRDELTPRFVARECERFLDDHVSSISTTLKHVFSYAYLSHVNAAQFQPNDP